MENLHYFEIRKQFDVEADKTDSMFTKELTECDRLSIDYLSKLVDPTKKVLEVGAGKGNVIESLNCQKYAIDLSPEMLKYCNIQNKQVANMDDLPFNNKEFDLVYTICTLQQSEDKEKTLEELERVGKNIVIIDGNKDSSIGKERDRLLKEGNWRTCGKAEWLSAKDFPDYTPKKLNNYIILLEKFDI